MSQQEKSKSKYITIIRPEFMSFCNDACRAASLNHLLFCIAGKSKDQPKENIQDGKVLWYATTTQISEQMSNAWGVCKVRGEVNELVRIGLLGRCSNPRMGVDRTKHFFFGQDQCTKFVDLCEENDVCLVHIGLPEEVKHLIYSSLANDRSIKCLCPSIGANDESIACKSWNYQMQMMNPSLANDESIEAITKNTTKITTKNTTEKTVFTQSANASASNIQTDLSEKEQEDTITLQAPDPIETQAIVGTQDTATAKPDNVPPNDTVSQQGLFGEMEPQEVKPVEEIPSQSKPQGTRRRSKKNDENQSGTEKPTLKPVLTEEEVAFKARCQGIYQRIVERRGFEFNTREEIIAERKAIRDHLAPNFTDDQIAFIHMHLEERDPQYWSLPENQVRIGACVIWRNSNKVTEFYRRKDTRQASNGRPQQESDLRVLYRQQLEWEAEAEREAMAQ